MKINILKMSFVDRIRYYSDNQIDEIIDSKRTHLIINYEGKIPANLVYLTSRIRDKKLKHKHRPIPVKMRNKNSAN